MKKLIFFIICILLLTSIMGCTPTPTNLPAFPTLPPPTNAPTQDPVLQAQGAFISVTISPYFASEGTQISVGEYSEELRTDNLQELTALAEKMSQQREILTPEQMYVLAIRFYNLGDKDTSIYWYYEAQFRARLFQQAVEPAQMVSTNDTTFLLSSAYDSFQKLVGEYINGYAGCDLDMWVKYTQMVKEDNPNPPELDQIFPDTLFVGRDRWQTINDEVGAGLAKLSNYISENGTLIKQQRAQQNMDAKYCS